MSDHRPTDDIERRLWSSLHGGELPAAPVQLWNALERVPDAPVIGAPARDGGTARGARAGWGVLGLAAVLALGGVFALSGGQRSPTPRPSVATPAVASAAPDPSKAAGSRITYEAVWTADRPANAADGAAIATILQMRLDATGMADARITRVGDSRFTVDLPPGIDPEPIRRLLGGRGDLVAVPTGDVALELGSSLDPGQAGRLFSSIDIASAGLAPDQNGNVAFLLTLRPPAAESFRAWTAASIGKVMALVVDGRVVAAPVIQSEILGGEIQLSFGNGSFGSEEASRVVAIIKPGPLPVAIREVALDVPAPSISTSSPMPVPATAIPSPNRETFALPRMQSGMGCDSVPAPYRSFTIHIDLSAAEPVWAIANTGARLRVEWGSTFRGLIGPPPTIIDDRGLILGDGKDIQVPSDAWPSIGDHFVCPSSQTVYVFNEAAPR